MPRAQEDELERPEGDQRGASDEEWARPPQRRLADERCADPGAGEEGEGDGERRERRPAQRLLERPAKRNLGCFSGCPGAEEENRRRRERQVDATPSGLLGGGHTVFRFYPIARALGDPRSRWLNRRSRFASANRASPIYSGSRAQHESRS